MVRKVLTFVLLGIAIVGVLLIGVCMVDHQWGVLGHSMGLGYSFVGFAIAFGGVLGAFFAAEAYEL